LLKVSNEKQRKEKKEKGLVDERVVQGFWAMEVEIEACPVDSV